MPKRVQTTMGSNSSMSNNEIAVDNNGLILNYNNSKYDYNGNPALMTFINAKSSVGLNNSNATGHYNLSVNTISEENGSGAVL